RLPARLCQLPQPPFSKPRCQSARSEPRTSTSIRPLPEATALGSAVSTPPSPSHGLQLEPSNDRCQSWLSLPRTKASRCPAAVLATPGPEPSTPPRDSQWETNFRLSSFQRSVDVPS